jgi:hypothetical protein
MAMSEVLVARGKQAMKGPKGLKALWVNVAPKVRLVPKGKKVTLVTRFP